MTFPIVTGSKLPTRKFSHVNMGSPTAFFQSTLGNGALERLIVYATKMAAVFMITISTIAAYTKFVPKYVAYLGYPLALLILLGSSAVKS
jgi:hypothetical protein